MIHAVENFIFARRSWIFALFTAATVFFCWQLSKLEIDAGFEKLLPLEHPFIQTFLDHGKDFGGANRLLICVRDKDGDIFNPEFFNTLKAVTDEVFFLPGVNRSTVQSIYTPNVRFIEIVEGGFSGGNVIWAEFQPTPDNLERARENILKSGTVGRLVANDFSAAMVSAQLVEIDPATGERLDYLKVASLLESKIRDPFVSDNVDIHIIGFAKTMGDIASGASGVILFFLIALVITSVMLVWFTKSFRLSILCILCSVIAVIWCLGTLPLLGFGLDPMSLLVPFLIFAIAVSHGVQMVNAMAAWAYLGNPTETAARRAFRSLAVPGTAALTSDAVGFLTLLLIDIRIIQELAVTAGVGVFAIVFTHMILLPLLLTNVELGKRYGSRMSRAKVARERLWEILSRFCQPWAVGAVTVALLFAVVGWHFSRDLQIGDIHEGVPELRPDSRYNRDTAVITEKFSIGMDILSTIVETVPDGCVEHDVMSSMDRFAWLMENVDGVQSTISLPQVTRIINAGWNEGHLKWRVLPRDTGVLAQSVSQVETASGLLNSDCSAMPVIMFLEDHKAETLERVVTAVEAYAEENNSERHRYRLATGNAGVMAATNEVVESAQVKMLLYIYAAVTLLCLVAFRSIRAAVCIILPLGLVSILAYGVMALLGIGLKTYTLPVVALGVGIGVDYGIYIFSRLLEGLEEGLPLREAYRQTLGLTGIAVLVTGLTLAVGVSTWIFSKLQFQADMGVLLTFMFLANMLGAVILLPAIARFLFYKHINPEKFPEE